MNGDIFIIRVIRVTVSGRPHTKEVDDFNVYTSRLQLLYKSYSVTSYTLIKIKININTKYNPKCTNFSNRMVSLHSKVYRSFT